MLRQQVVVVHQLYLDSRLLLKHEHLGRTMTLVRLLALTVTQPNLLVVLYRCVCV
jgi:hypothetical protein